MRGGILKKICRKSEGLRGLERPKKAAGNVLAIRQYSLEIGFHGDIFYSLKVANSLIYVGFDVSSKQGGINVVHLITIK